MATIRDRFIPQLQSTVRLLEGAADDYDPLLAMIDDNVPAPAQSATTA